jgi:hypothetical protein
LYIQAFAGFVQFFVLEENLEYKDFYPERILVPFFFGLFYRGLKSQSSKQEFTEQIPC